MRPALTSDHRFQFKSLPDTKEGGCHARVWVPNRLDRDIKVVLMWHGGGYALGDETNVPVTEVQYLVKQGAVVVSAQYRLAPHARFADIVEDALDAYEWVWTKLAGLLEVDNVRSVALEGWSAGAFISGMVSSLYTERHLSKPSAICLHYGSFNANIAYISVMPGLPLPEDVVGSVLHEPASTGTFFDLTKMAVPSPRDTWTFGSLTHNMLWQYMYNLPADTKELPSTYSPTDLVSSSWPPTFVVIATQDQVVPVEHSHGLIRNLRAAGVQCAQSEVEMGHGESENATSNPELSTQDAETIYWERFEQGFKPGLDFMLERL